MWERAQKIAKAMLDGQLWLPEVDRSTHYHAYWVRPSWVSEMKRMYKTGVHTFYRPRNWGDGSDAPSWGTADGDRGHLGQARRSRAKLGRAGECEAVALSSRRARPIRGGNCDADRGCLFRNMACVWVPAFAGTTTRVLNSHPKLHSTILQGCPARKNLRRRSWDFHANALTPRNVPLDLFRSGHEHPGKLMAATADDLRPATPQLADAAGDHHLRLRRSRC